MALSGLVELKANRGFKVAYLIKLESTNYKVRLETNLKNLISWDSSVGRAADCRVLWRSHRRVIGSIPVPGTIGICDVVVACKPSKLDSRVQFPADASSELYILLNIYD